MSIGVTGPWVGGKGLSVGTPVTKIFYFSGNNYTFTVHESFLTSHKKNTFCSSIWLNACQRHMIFHLTVELLDSFDVILRKPEVFSVSVNGGHQCSRVLRVLQAKSMTKLMGCHQEQTVAWKHATQ